MIIDVGSEIRIHQPDYATLCEIAGYLTLKRGRYRQSNEKVRLYHYNQAENILTIPFGMLHYLFMRFPEKSCYRTFFRTTECIQYKSRTNIREYQAHAIKIAEAMKNGLIEMPCGSGKTITALNLICRLQQPALWITHTQDLLTQSKSAADKNISSPYPHGLIAQGKFEISRGLTFATVQKLYRCDLNPLRDYWGVVIVDEAHRAFMTQERSAMFEKVLSKLCARHKYGLTATLHRSDNMESSITSLIGPLIHKLDKKKIKHHLTDMVYIVPITSGLPDVQADFLKSSNLEAYSKIISYVTKNDIRNQLIAGVLNKNQDHYCLVLSDRVKHLEALRKKVKAESVIISGDSKAGDREKALDRVRRGEIHFLFATYNLAREGLDLPRLDRLFMTTPKRDITIVEQSIGRVERSFTGKKKAIVYDFVDERLPILFKQFMHRRDIYIKNGFYLYNPISKAQRRYHA